jgi:hypothetical protein
MEGTDETREIGPPRETDAAPTIAFDAPRHQVRPGYLALIFCVVAAAGFLIGIAVAAASRPTPPKIGDVAAEQTIGPSGGTLRFEDGQLEIPPDALAQPVHIVIRRSSFADRVRVLPPAGSPEVFEPGGLAAYTFGPANVSFLTPVHIVFRLPVGSRNGTAFARSGNDIVILGGVIDADRQTVTVSVRDFLFAKRAAK